MTQIIDPIKLKAAAEHLEWVLQQYPDSEDVQSLLQALQPLMTNPLTYDEAIRELRSNPQDYASPQQLRGL